MNNNPIFDLIVQDNKIKPLSPTFAKLGGKPHSQGGTTVMVPATGEVVEAQKGEPLSTQTDGSIVAWGKMMNPHTGNTFEKDANILAELENRTTKLANKADNLITKDSNNLSFTTGQVLMDAAAARDIDTTLAKEVYAKTQQDILDMSETLKADPKKTAKNMAKNGVTLNDPLKVRVRIKNLPKAADGRTFTSYKQYEEELQKTLANNQNILIPDFVQPRNQLAGQRTQGNTYGDAYNTSFDVFNQIQNTWGLPVYDNTTPEGVKRYQTEYNQAFRNRTGSDYYMGVNDPSGIDSKYGNKTSSQQPFRATYRGVQDQTLNAQQIANMSDDEFKAVSGQTKAEFAKNNPDLTGVWEYNFSPNNGRQPIESLATDSFLNPTRGVQPVQAPNPTIEARQPYTEQYVPETLQRSSLADRNRLPLTSIIPEIAAILDQPNYVPRQEYRPQYQQAYQISYQDRINQNQADFNRLQTAMSDNPLALATLAAEKRRADAQVLSEEFRANQGISSAVANSNIETYNQAQGTNLQLADQQYMRQEQARSNTEAGRQRALNSISSKFQTRQAENNAIRLLENFSNFRVDNNFNAVNQNAPAQFQDAQGNIIQLTEAERQAWIKEQNAKNRSQRRFSGLF